MAGDGGIGGSWGSREELLHPRDSHGRFRKTFKMAENAINAITNFLDKFQPRTFQSDNQAAQYVFNRAKPSRFGGGQGYPRLHADLDETNEHLRSGQMDESTKKFVQMMDASAINTPEPLILSRTMDAHSFGLTPETLGNEQGGLEDLTGWVIKDPGYSTTVIGTPMGHGPGKVTMVIATPKGTKAIIPARSPGDRAVFLDRDQEFAISKVQSDGRGGFYVMAVAVPKTGKSDHEPLSPGPRGAGLTPQQREQRVLGLQQAQANRMKQGEQPAAGATSPIVPHQNSPTGPTDTGPNGPPPRNEPIHAPSIGVGTPPPSEAVLGQAPTPGAPTPQAPAAPTPDLRTAVREAGIQWPSDGARRKQFNNAYLGIIDGKKHPEDTLRQLEADIRTNKDTLGRDKGEVQGVGTLKREGDIAKLDSDIKSQEQLADLIAKQFGLQRAQEPKAPAAPPVKKAVPSKVTPIGQAPGEKHRGIPGEAGSRQVTNLEARRAAKTVQAPRGKQEEPAPPPAKKAAPGVAKVLPIKKTAPATPSTSAGVPQRIRPRDVKVGDTIAGSNSLPGRTDNPKIESKVVARIERSPGRGGNQQFLFFDGKGERIGSASPNSFVWRRAEGAPSAPSAPAAKKTAPTPETPNQKRERAQELIRSTAGMDEQQARPIRQEAQRLTREADQADLGARSVAKKAAPAKAAPVAKKALPRKGTLADAKREAALSAFFKNDMSAEDKAGGKFRFIRDLFSEGRISLPEARSGASDEAAHWRREQTRLIDAGDGTKADEAGRIADRYEKLASDLRDSQSVVATDKIRQAAKKAAPAAPEVPAGNRIPVRGGGFVDTRTGELHGGPNAPTPEAAAAPDIDKMTKAELLTHAGQQGITARQSWTKDKIKEAIRGGGGTPAAPAAKPVEPNAPAAQKVIQAPDRREAFAEDWINTPALAKINENTAAGRSINEVRDDVLKGKITPDEGIRRLENDIDLNKQDLAEMQQELRGDLPADEREAVSAAVDKLRKGISDQELASSFMRKHFRQAPTVTPKEVEVQLDPEAKKIVDSAGPDDIREAAKIAGFGELKGENKDELLQDLVKKIAGKELASRAAKKAAPKKLAPTPLVTKKSGDPDYVDAKAIAEGLGMDESDSRMLKHVQDMLDGTGGEEVHTPAAVGRRLHEMNNGAGSPSWERVVHGQLTLERLQARVAGREPSLAGLEQDKKDLKEAEAKDARLKAQSERWNALADRLLKTRRRPARKATEPAPEKPKLTTEEKKVTAQAAEVLGVPKEQLQSRALAKKVAAAPPAEAAKSAVEQMSKMQSREEADAFLKNRTKAELQEILKASGVSVPSKDSKAELARKIVRINVATRLEFKALTEAAPELKRQRMSSNLEDMTPAQLADLESSLGIKRVSLDRGDRIAAIKAAQAEANAQASIPKSLPSSGKRWNWETIQEDNMTMHGDSASMNLAQKLHKAGREDAAQYVADMRFRISNNRGEHDAADVEKMVADLKKMRDAELDPNLKKAYDRALEDIDAPQSPAPPIPTSTPKPLKKMMSELNQIPVARRTGHFAGTTKEVSAVDRLAELIRKVEAGDAGSIGTVESEINRILHSFHESVDGAFQMWRLDSLIDSPDIRTWIRSHYPKT